MVEVARKAYLASLVPVIVNTILNEHQIVADIVAFVNKGDFPRSRLGEKQRGKILASWVTSKMRTMAQFGIRDADAGLSDVTETAEPHQVARSLRNSSIIASSLRRVDSVPRIMELREPEQQQMDGALSLPTPIAELPTPGYNESMLDSTTLGGGSTTKSDDTPTEPKPGHFELSNSPVLRTKEETSTKPPVSRPTSSQRPSLMVINKTDDDLPSAVGPKPLPAVPQLPLPAVDGREGDLWTLPSQRTYGDLQLKIPATEEDDDWSQDALMHMNLGSN